MTNEQKLGVLIANVVVGWSVLLGYFPQDEPSKEAVMRLLFNVVNTPAELDWLNQAMVNQLGEWKGAKAMREVFCRRFRPKDGIEADAEEPVFTLGEVAQVKRLTAAEPREERLLPSGVEPWKEGEAEERIKAAAERKRIRKPTGADKAAAAKFMERVGL